MNEGWVVISLICNMFLKNAKILYKLRKKLSFKKKLEKNARQDFFKLLIYAPQRRGMRS